MHQHIIGLIHGFDLSELVSLESLNEFIQACIRQKEWLDRNPKFKNHEYAHIDDMKIWSIKDYADRRKSTNFERFDFCPICGEKIDWKAIKAGDDV